MRHIIQASYIYKAENKWGRGERRRGGLEEEGRGCRGGRWEEQDWRRGGTGRRTGEGGGKGTSGGVRVCKGGRNELKK